MLKTLSRNVRGSFDIHLSLGRAAVVMMSSSRDKDVRKFDCARTGTRQEYKLTA